MAVFQCSFSNYYSEPRTNWDPVRDRAQFTWKRLLSTLVAEPNVTYSHNGPIARPAHKEQAGSLSGAFTAPGWSLAVPR
jgi:hypothetical protein